MKLFVEFVILVRTSKSPHPQFFPGFVHTNSYLPAIVVELERESMSSGCQPCVHSASSDVIFFEVKFDLFNSQLLLLCCISIPLILPSLLQRGILTDDFTK